MLNLRLFLRHFPYIFRSISQTQNISLSFPNFNQSLGVYGATNRKIDHFFVFKIKQICIIYVIETNVINTQGDNLKVLTL